MPAADLADFKKGESLLYKQNDSAFYYFNKFISLSKDSLQSARAYTYMAAIQFDAGDYFGSQESLSAALKLLKEENKLHYKCLAADYNELGMNSIKLNDNRAAVSFFDKALLYSENPKLELIIKNNKAKAFEHEHDYASALNIYKQIIKQTPDREKDYARLKTNMALAAWYVNSSYNPVPDLLNALSIRSKAADIWGKNSSYAHLADYYLIPKPDSAFYYASLMYETAKSLNSPEDKLEALQKLITSGPSNVVKSYFLRYRQLSDSLQTSRNAAKNQFALIRYQTEKSKSENLKLQKDNADKKFQITRQQTYVYLAFSTLIAVGLIAFFWHRKQKQVMDIEAKRKVKESELAASKKVHDSVANKIYQIIAEIDNGALIVRDDLLDKLDVVYKKSRNIYAEHEQTFIKTPAQTISDLIKSFAGDSTRISLVGNSEEVWFSLSKFVLQQVELILLELMVNMKKHSKAKNVVLKFEKTEHYINVVYNDDGVGFAPDVTYQNGLKSTETRIKNINGKVTFDGSSKMGTSIVLSFPAI